MRVEHRRSKTVKSICKDMISCTVKILNFLRTICTSRLDIQWHVVAESVIGRAHRSSGRSCQDAVGSYVDRNLAYVAVADGAGSAAFSDRGASIAIEQSLIVLKRTVPWKNVESVKAQILDSCLRTIIAEADRIDCKPRELATTLAFVCVNHETVISGSIGDCIVISYRNDQPELTHPPQQGEFHNETVFMTSSGVERYFRVQCGPLDGRNGFSLMSDGAAEALFHRRTNSPAPAISKMLGWVKAKDPSIASAKIREDVLPKLTLRSRDDCSLCLMARAATRKRLGFPDR